MTSADRPQQCTETRRQKPAKPSPDFPLSPRANGQWAKKIHGKWEYFGPWSHPEDALARYQARIGGHAKQPVQQVTLADLINCFLRAREPAKEAGEISEQTFELYWYRGEQLVQSFGRNRPVDSLTPSDFRELRSQLARKYSPATLTVAIRQIRTIFLFGRENMNVFPTMGSEFKAPSARLLRKARNEGPERFFEAAQIRKLLAAANFNLRAMVYLGVNCGFGCSDCAHLRLKFLDLENGWIEYPRRKTEVMRLCPLWPETVVALRAAIDRTDILRKLRKHDYVFVRRNGRPFADCSPTAVSSAATVLLKRVGLHSKGVGFYSLRHVFQTIGERAKDPVAVSAIMGHAPRAGDMSDHYRHMKRDRQRLVAVTAAVRDWLLNDDQEQLRVVSVGA